LKFIDFISIIEGNFLKIKNLISIFVGIISIIKNSVSMGNIFISTIFYDFIISKNENARVSVDIASPCRLDGFPPPALGRSSL
jgi:hypothetical protein